MKAITVLIPSIFATAVTDTCMRIAPLFQAAINVAHPCKYRYLVQWSL